MFRVMPTMVMGDGRRLGIFVFERAHGGFGTGRAVARETAIYAFGHNTDQRIGPAIIERTLNLHRYYIPGTTGSSDHTGIADHDAYITGLVRNCRSRSQSLIEQRAN